MRADLRGWVRRTAAMAMALALGGCGGTEPNVPQPTNGTITAQIDGGNFTASSIAATYTNGILGIGATDSQGRSIGIGGQVPGPGTYSVGVTNPTNFSVSIGAAAWQAAITLGSGSFTVTSISATGVKGTFQFTAGPLTTTGATGNKVVTAGAFDVNF